MTTVKSDIKIDRKEAIAVLWQRGNLRWKLYENQKIMYDSIKQSGRKQTIISCARRFGKSHLMCILAVEACLKKSNSIVKYVCPQQNMVKTILKPIMNKIFKDCPPELKPEYKTNDKMYLFPNGSQIQMAGTDKGHHESLRGGESILWIVDEAGFCDELKYVVNSVLAPTADTTGGSGIIASTPSPIPDHEFNIHFFEAAEQKSELLKFTIYDNPMLSERDIQDIINRFPLKEQDPEFRREYLCIIDRQSDSIVIPEFTTEVQKDIIVEWPRPAYYDCYTSMDIGHNDFTVVLFAYYDFKNAVTVIEDEHVVNGPALRSDTLASTIRKKEQLLWLNAMTGEMREPYLRIADNNNLILLNDLTLQHGLIFFPTAKDENLASINNVRTKVADRRLIIHPRCKTLIHHMKNAVWDKNRKTYRKGPDGSHYDALDACKYLLRNVQETKNPYPAGYGLRLNGESHMRSNTQFDSKLQFFKDMFTPKKSIKR